MPTKTHTLWNKQRTPWTAQPMRMRKETESRHHHYPVSSKRLAVRVIAERGMKSLSLEEKKKFMRDNRQETLAVFKENTHEAMGTIQEGFEDILKKLSEKSIEVYASAVWKKVMDEEKKKTFPVIVKIVTAYFKERQIPVKGKNDLELVETAIRRHYQKHPFTVYHPLPLREIEGLYLILKKNRRKYDYFESIRINRFVREGTKGLRLTANQKRVAKRMAVQKLRELNKKIRELDMELADKVKDANEDEWQRIFQENYDHLLKTEKQYRKEAAAAFRREMESVFFTKQKGKSTAALAPTNSAPKKSGTRDERLAAYAPSIRESEEKTERLEIATERSQAAGRQFDSVEYSMRELSKENPAAAEAVGLLLKNRLLDRGSVVKLFIAGSLTQKIFLQIISDPDFQSQFGNESISSLARGLAFIGPKGKLIDRAKRAFQSKRARELFEFLDKKGFLETHHGDGKVVYLRR